MRILVADDERDLNALIAQKLRKEHYSVDCCHDGEEALEYLRMADYDAVVLDIMMPKKDGISVLKELRANGSHVPVLLLTAKDSIEDRVLQGICAAQLHDAECRHGAQPRAARAAHLEL